MFVSMFSWFKGRHPLSEVNHRGLSLITGLSGHLYLYVLGFRAYMF
jgi:hypothetical protein